MGILFTVTFLLAIHHVLLHVLPDWLLGAFDNREVIFGYTHDPPRVRGRWLAFLVFFQPVLLPPSAERSTASATAHTAGITQPKDPDIVPAVWPVGVWFAGEHRDADDEKKAKTVC